MISKRRCSNGTIWELSSNMKVIKLHLISENKNLDLKTQKSIYRHLQKKMSFLKIEIVMLKPEISLGTSSITIWRSLEEPGYISTIWGSNFSISP
ncbi:hypothetical protein FXV91_07590 [Methanosarcina sp. DH2]|uniref:hypothetical protein n=1 Tax=Methanosarcina sp. DH2 TaxID=2605639 RepID=UPI001E41AB5E|nr:hypothetical protein [Methanosarcina sp. DH2]MCC4770066.1 hypothetical protein [Methanosarcina sp. DH2]